MFMSQPVDGVTYVAQPRTRGGKLVIWTRVPVAAGPEVRVAATDGLATLTDNAS